jgi:hypothetical protein
MQKYLSFDIVSMKKPKNEKCMNRSASDRRLHHSTHSQPTKMTSAYGLETNDKYEKRILMEKINKIHSYREPENQSLTQIPNMYKKTSNLIVNAVSAHPKSIEEKENANNDPMHRNNQYVSEL